MARLNGLRPKSTASRDSEEPFLSPRIGGFSASAPFSPLALAVPFMAWSQEYAHQCNIVVWHYDTSTETLCRFIDDWLNRKLSDFYTLRQPATVTHEWKRMAHGELHASVTLSATPANHFSFVSRIQWPVTASSRYEECIVDGIPDALFAPRGQISAILGVSVILEQMIWYEEGGVHWAFYMAAREATQKLIEGNIGEKAGLIGESPSGAPNNTRKCISLRHE